jgi:hypothetical protein
MALAKLDTTLDKIDAAEKQALMDLSKAGYWFQSIDEARAFRERRRKEARLLAAGVDEMSMLRARRSA